MTHGKKPPSAEWNRFRVDSQLPPPHVVERHLRVGRQREPRLGLRAAEVERNETRDSLVEGRRRRRDVAAAGHAAEKENAARVDRRLGEKHRDASHHVLGVPADEALAGELQLEHRDRSGSNSPAARSCTAWASPCRC